MEQSPRLSLSYLAPSQAQKHVTVNETFRRLDQLVQQTVLSRTTSAQPGSPADGDAYIMPASPTGADWSAYAQHSIAAYQDGAWVEIVPAEGWRAWVNDEDALVMYDGSAWAERTGAYDLNGEDLTLDADADSYIHASADDEISLVLANAERAKFYDAGIGLYRNGSRPELELKRSDTHGDNQVLGQLVFFGKDDGGAETTYVTVRGYCAEDANGNESGEFILRTMNAATFATRCTVGAGLYMEGATGGDKGAGTINAQGVYDDNTLLSCYVFDQTIDGSISLAKWDGKVPDRIIPGQEEEKVLRTQTETISEEIIEIVDGEHVKRQRQREETVPVLGPEEPVLDESGDPIVKERREKRRNPKTGKIDVVTVKVPLTRRPPLYDTVPGTPDQVVKRRHDPARRFAALIGTAHDPLTLDGYAKHWKEKRHLPSLPDEAGFDPVNDQLTSGDWIQRLTETVEIQAVLIDQLNQRVKALEGGRRS